MFCTARPRITFCKKTTANSASSSLFKCCWYCVVGVVKDKVKKEEIGHTLEKPKTEKGCFPIFNETF